MQARPNQPQCRLTLLYKTARNLAVFSEAALTLSAVHYPSSTCSVREPLAMVRKESIKKKRWIKCVGTALKKCNQRRSSR